MVRGFYRRLERDQYDKGNVLAAIYNTIPKRKGSKGYTADDFIPKKPGKSSAISLEDRHELAKEALERSERFDRGGVVYSEMRDIDIIKHG